MSASSGLGADRTVYLPTEGRTVNTAEGLPTWIKSAPLLFALLTILCLGAVGVGAAELGNVTHQWSARTLDNLGKWGSVTLIAGSGFDAIAIGVMGACLFVKISEIDAQMKCRLAPSSTTRDR